MSMPVTAFSDNAVGADSLGIGANWDSGYSGEDALQRISNTFRSVTTNAASETVNAVSLPANQWAEITLGTFTNNGSLNLAMVTLRAAAPTAATWYEFVASIAGGSYTSRIVYRLAGSNTAQQLDSGVTWVAGDVLRGEAIGSSLSLYRNGSLVTSMSDAALTSGRAGVRILDVTQADVRVSLFTAGYWIEPQRPTVRSQAVQRASTF